MFCRRCGFQNSDNAYKCIQCGETLDQIAGPVALAQQIPNYLVQSILVTLLCCVPFGIVAIVYSAQVNGKVQSGDIQGAMNASRKAKMWGWIAFGVGFAWGLLYAAFMAINIASGNMR